MKSLSTHQSQPREQARVQRKGSVILLLLHPAHGVAVDLDELALADLARVHERIQLRGKHGLDKVCAVREHDAPALGCVCRVLVVVVDGLGGEDLQRRLLKAGDRRRVGVVDGAHAAGRQKVGHGGQRGTGGQRGRRAGAGTVTMRGRRELLLRPSASRWK